MTNQDQLLSWTNWVGNQSFSPGVIADVSCETEIQHHVASAVEKGRTVRTCGAGHSFTPIVETKDVLLNMAGMKGVLHIDRQKQLVTAQPSTSIAEFGDPLWANGLALNNQGDIDTQSIAGAIATATHGSGSKLPSFSANLVGAKVVDGMGRCVEITREQTPSELAALQTSIGLLGIMSEITVQAVPAYDLHMRYEVLPFSEMMERFDSYLNTYRSCTFFWCPTDDSGRLYGFRDAKADDCAVRLFQTPFADLDYDNLPPDERVGRSYHIYPMKYEPNFHEMEYFIPLNQAQNALIEMRKLMKRWLPLSIFPMEVRTVAAEDAWMSPNYQRDNLVISISGQPGTDYWGYLRACDSLFAEFSGRPHWGKLHFMTADRLERLFPRYQNFVELRRRFDPRGTFLNKHTRDLFE